jgi:hypothetical protein
MVILRNLDRKFEGEARSSDVVVSCHEGEARKLLEIAKMQKEKDSLGVVDLRTRRCEPQPGGEASEMERGKGKDGRDAKGIEHFDYQRLPPVSREGEKERKVINSVEAALKGRLERKSK